MSGFKLHTDPKQVKQFWYDHAREMLTERGFMFVNRRDATDFQTNGFPVFPYVNHGRWVADCPNCNGGMACWVEAGECCCLDCGTIYVNIEWPSKQTLKAAEDALAHMPVPEMRNWVPREEHVRALDARMKAQTPVSAEEQIAERLGVAPGTVADVLSALKDMPERSISFERQIR